MVRRAPSQAFWSQQRVFVTGHTGFKGGWLTLWLHSLGATVHGYALPAATDPSLHVAARVADAGRETIGDVRDAALLARSMVQFAPTIVFHLAAQPLVRLSYEAPVDTYSINVMGTVHLLEAVRACPSARAAIIVTSDKCYENRETIWPYRETDPMGGHDPYSSSKGCTELIASAYARSFFQRSACGLASVRAGNVIGGGDWSRDRLVPDLIRAFSADEAAIIRRPEAVRPWQHVLEPLCGYLLAAERVAGNGGVRGDAWNFGPSAEGSVEVGKVVELAAAAWGEDARFEVRVNADAVHEATLLSLDATKAMHELGWKPAWSLPETVLQTIGWYRAFYDGADMRVFTTDQIARYGAALGLPR